MNYFTGEKIHGTVDLELPGMMGLQLKRNFVTQPEYAGKVPEGKLGPGWTFAWPKIVRADGVSSNQILLVTGSRHGRSFTSIDGINYSSDYFYKEKFDHVGQGFNLRDVDGNSYSFGDWSGYPFNPPDGGLHAYRNSYGTEVDLVHNGSWQLIDVVQKDPSVAVGNETRLTFTYYTTPAALVGLVQSVTAKIRSGGVDTVVRSVEYTYYTTNGTNGSAGTLQRARIKDPAGAVIETKYYRSNAVDASGRLPLRLIVEGESYERLKAGVGGTDNDVDLAGDLAVEPYANYKFTYDASMRVVSEVVQGKGTYSFGTPTDSGFAHDPNNWKRKTEETLPGGDKNIVYTNYLGQAVMRIFKETATSKEWKTWFQRDGVGRVTTEATPSAVTGYDELYPNLVDGDGGFNMQYIADFSGLVKRTYYATTTTATDVTPGDVAGYLLGHDIHQGELGGYIQQDWHRYWAHPAGGGVYPIAMIWRYRNDDASGSQITNYSYTWHNVYGLSGPSTRPASITITKPAGLGVITTHYDPSGRPTWEKDEDGFINVNRYDLLKGALTQRILDVQTTTTTDEPSGWVTPAGGGLHLIWNFESDGLSRTTRVQDPDNRNTYTIHKDANWETRVYPGWTGTATTGPIQVSRKDKAGSYSESYTTSVAAASSAGKPTGTELLDPTTLTASTLHSLERTFKDANGRVTHMDTYFSFSGLAYTTGTSLGTQGTHTVATGVHFHRRSYGYDSRGRRDRETDWTGTLRKKVFDGRSRVTSEWIGTSDANVVKTHEYEYDNNGIGNDHLTKSKFFTSATTSLDTTYVCDFRGRRTDTLSPISVAPAIAGVATKLTYDNLSQVTMEETYSTSDFTYAASELRGRREKKYDELGRVYQEITHHVDPSSGAVGNRLTTNHWFNGRSLRIKTRGPNGQFQKTRYDGVGRVTGTFVSYDDAETTQAQAGDVSSDTVISQLVYALDGAGNVIQETSYERSSAAPGTLFGELSTSWTETNSRRSYVATWFDLAGRITAVVDYGRNGGTTLTRPTNPPAPNLSNMVLVTKYDYSTTSGRQEEVRNNKNILTKITFDMLGRETQVVENYQDNTVGNAEYASDRTVIRTYDGGGRLWKLTAKNPKGTSVQDQITTFGYGMDALSATPIVWRNDVLAGVIYPDSNDTFTINGAAGARFSNVDTTYDREEFTYDYAGRRLTWKKPLETTHTYTYDAVGRPSTDQVTNLGSGIDGAVRRIEYTYDNLWRRLTVSSYSATSGGTLRNQVSFTYNGWGQEVGCAQGHEGSASGAPSFSVAIVEGGTPEAKYARRSSMTYPNGRVVHVNYPAANSIGDKLSRPDNLANDASGTTKYAQYTYLGIRGIVKVAHPAVTGGLNLVYGTGTGNPGGWDDVGRVDDQKWESDTFVLKDQYQYGYDNTSNRTFRDNLTANALGKDQFFTVDGLDRLSIDKRGDLNAGRTDITTPAYREDWTLEALGNWRQLVQTTSGTVTLNQTRTHTAANETTTIASTVGTNWGDGALDRNGNMTRVPKPSSLGQRWRLTYDAWGRVVRVVDDVSPNPVIAEYKYDGLHRRTVKLKPNGANWDRIDYFYSCDWQIVEERQLLNNASKVTVATIPLNQYIWDLRYIDAVILRFRNEDFSVDGSLEQTLYYMQDANMNVTGLVNTSGTVVERVQYDAYGNHALFQVNWTTAQASTVYKNEVLFAGYRLDPESGMYQVRHRHYHPTLGRWIQRDFLGYHDSMNLYEYVRSNSPNAYDPSGLAQEGQQGKKQPKDKGQLEGDIGPCLIQIRSMYFMAAKTEDTILDMPDGVRIANAVIKGNYYVIVANSWGDNCCCKKANVRVEIQTRAGDVALSGPMVGSGEGGGSPMRFETTDEIPGNIGKWKMLGNFTIDMLKDTQMWTGYSKGTTKYRLMVVWSCAEASEDRGANGVAKGTYVSYWSMPAPGTPNTWFPKGK